MEETPRSAAAGTSARTVALVYLGVALLFVTGLDVALHRGLPHQERVFRPFERLHGADRYPGTGIGLSIVRRGVERMGGKVGLRSAVGEGSRFWIELRSADPGART